MALEPTAHLRTKRHNMWNTYHLQQWWYDKKTKKGIWKEIKEVPFEASNYEREC